MSGFPNHNVCTTPWGPCHYDTISLVTLLLLHRVTQCNAVNVSHSTGGLTTDVTPARPARGRDEGPHGKVSASRGVRLARLSRVTDRTAGWWCHRERERRNTKWRPGAGLYRGKLARVGRRTVGRKCGHVARISTKTRPRADFSPVEQRSLNWTY